MRCPFCKHSETQVKDTRTSEDAVSIKRRRYCPECHARFTTTERYQIRQLFVVKKNGQRVEFEQEKLFKSLKICLRKRPVPLEKIDKIVANIVKKLEMLNETEIPSQLIGEYVMHALKEVDNVAYIRYASVYMDFSNSADFQKMLNSLTPAIEPV